MVALVWFGMGFALTELLADALARGRPSASPSRMAPTTFPLNELALAALNPDHP